MYIYLVVFFFARKLEIGFFYIYVQMYIYLNKNSIYKLIWKVYRYYNYDDK